MIGEGRVERSPFLSRQTGSRSQRRLPNTVSCILPELRSSRRRRNHPFSSSTPQFVASSRSRVWFLMSRLRTRPRESIYDSLTKTQEEKLCGKETANTRHRPPSLTRSKKAHSLPEIETLTIIMPQHTVEPVLKPVYIFAPIQTIQSEFFLRESRRVGFKSANAKGAQECCIFVVHNCKEAPTESGSQPVLDTGIVIEYTNYKHLLYSRCEE